MASRRNLKKNVNKIVADLYGECFFQELLKPNVKAENIDAVLEDIYKLKMEFISRISHTEPGNVKGFYKKFKEDFSKGATEIIAKIGSLA